MKEQEIQRIKALAGQNPFAKYIGMELVEVDEGYAFGRINFERQHENIYGGMHGGCAYSLADTVSGIAAATYGTYVTTLNASMNYLLPVENTNYVNCRARVVRHGRRISVFSIKITNDEEQVLIDGNFTFYNLSKEMA
ncbi:MAG: PaaI family thioesterase [Hespellia sp.]|nr:PaaI family thioesterase [Hespellia sp.]